MMIPQYIKFINKINTNWTCNNIECSFLYINIHEPLNIRADLLAFLRSLTNSADCWWRISEFRDSFSRAITSSCTLDFSFLSLCNASCRSRDHPSGKSCDFLSSNGLVSEVWCSASFIKGMKYIIDSSFYRIHTHLKISYT